MCPSRCPIQLNRLDHCYRQLSSYVGHKSHQLCARYRRLRAAYFTWCLNVQHGVFRANIKPTRPELPRAQLLTRFLLALLLAEFIRRQTRRYTHTQIDRQKTHSPLGWSAFACSGNRPAQTRAPRNRCAASVLRGLFLPILSLSSFPAGKEWHQ